ncbi:MAG: hypothetical protein COU66_02245 [Candidatus Pacebacteria bacterium CG10_big_fil_rev_8_21_14_0_10_44_11]|nr:MAG: hypothetical protein COU66_02245 [Candidatus Pacebacteria bacterium CG10_big_fil_rev_8_21_14_0_10_44_11]
MKAQKASKQPLVSVILPVYNASRFLAQAISSILNQTHHNWELIIIDDCSTDNSTKIAQNFAKQNPRIKLIKQKKHLGVGAVANKAMKLAKGAYIARMDADDISLPSRLAKQVSFLEKHQNLIGVGGQCQLIDSSNTVIGHKNFPTDPEEIKEMMFHYYPVQQPTFMVRASKLPKHFEWYDEQLPSAEEHELLFKLLQYGKVANLPAVTLQYRMHENNVSKQHPKRDFFNIFSIRLKAVKKYGYRPSFTGMLKNLAQLIIIALLPERLIFPLHNFALKFRAH